MYHYSGYRKKSLSVPGNVRFAGSFSQVCSMKHADAFALCMIEGEIFENDHHHIAPTKTVRT